MGTDRNEARPVSSIQARIAEVLHKNGCHVDDATELAAALAAEFGLTQEIRSVPTVYSGGIGHSPRRESRYVTEWREI